MNDKIIDLCRFFAIKAFTQYYFKSFSDQFFFDVDANSVFSKAKKINKQMYKNEKQRQKKLRSNCEKMCIKNEATNNNIINCKTFKAVIKKCGKPSVSSIFVAIVAVVIGVNSHKLNVISTIQNALHILFRSKKNLFIFTFKLFEHVVHGEEDFFFSRNSLLSWCKRRIDINLFYCEEYIAEIDTIWSNTSPFLAMTGGGTNNFFYASFFNCFYELLKCSAMHHNKLIFSYVQEKIL